MPYEIDDFMKIGPNDCPRCGTNKNYHTMKVDGKIYMRCIRKKPYKLADGVDVHLGMQVWHFHRWDSEYKIITGMVRFIGSWGGLTLWKYPEDRHPETFEVDGKTVTLRARLSHEGLYTAKFSCYSSLKNVQEAVEKRKKEVERLEKWKM